MDDKPGEPSSIPLYVIAGVATVWDAQHVATIHCAHDISGLRAGTLPGVVQQNAFLGLPLTLMPEEAAALVNKGVAHLVPLSPGVKPPPAALVAERTEQRVARARAQAERMRAAEDAKAAEVAAKYATNAGKAAEKRIERGRKRADAARTAALAAGDDLASVQRAYDEAIAALERPAEEKKYVPPKRPEPTSENTNLFTVIPSLPVHESLVPKSTTPLGSAAFPFPRNVRERALVETFAALQARGLRMGLGPRFGGEWLVYPGDYLRYHAHFTSQVIVRDEPIRPAEIVAWGRLGTGTKKAGLLCCWDDGKEGEADTGSVEFYSLEWANFG